MINEIANKLIEEIEGNTCMYIEFNIQDLPKAKDDESAYEMWVDRMKSLPDTDLGATSLGRLIVVRDIFSDEELLFLKEKFAARFFIRENIKLMYGVIQGHPNKDMRFLRVDLK